MRKLFVFAYKFFLLTFAVIAIGVATNFYKDLRESRGAEEQTSLEIVSKKVTTDPEVKEKIVDIKISNNSPEDLTTTSDLDQNVTEDKIQNQTVSIFSLIPKISNEYFQSLDGSNLFNLDADHLGGLAESSLLKSDRDDWFEAQLIFTQAPGGPTADKAPLYINPATSGNNDAMFGIALAGDELFKVTSLGDVSVTRDINIGGQLNSSSGYITGNLTVDGTITGDIVGTISPGLTQGSVAFIDSSGNFTEDNSNFYWDDTNNRLGIGTTSPSTSLDVFGSITGANSKFLVRESSAAFPSVLELKDDDSNARGKFIVIKDNTSSFGVDTQYTFLLATADGANAGVAAFPTTERTDGKLQLGGLGTSTLVKNISLIATPDNDSDIAVTLGSKTGGTVSQSLNLLKSGNVGIGTTSPGAPFQVGDSSISHTQITSGFLDVRYADTSRVSLSQNYGVSLVGYNSGGIRIRGADVEKYAYILAGSSSYDNALILNPTEGNVGIGTITPDSRLQVEGAVRGKALVTINETGDQDIFTASSSGTTKFVIDNNGYVGIGTSDPQSALNISTGTGSLSTGLSFGDSDTGFYENLDDQITISIGGSDLARYVANELRSLTTGGAAVRWAASSDSYNTFSFLGDSDTGMRRPAADTLTFQTNATERLRIDSTGNVGIGTSDPLHQLNIVNEISQNSVRGVNISQHTDDGNSPLFVFRKSRGTSSSPSIVQANDFAGAFQSRVYTGTGGVDGYIRPAAFGFQVSGAPTTTTAETNFFVNTNNVDDPTASNVNLFVDYLGRLSINSGSTIPDPGAQFFVTNGSSTRRGAIIQAANSQTANLLELHDSSSNVLLTLGPNGDAVFNEAGADADFRIEGDTDANLFFVDASTDRVGIGTNTPTNLLHIEGDSDTQSVSIRLTDNDATTGSKSPFIDFYGSTTRIARIVGNDVNGLGFADSSGATDMRIDLIGNVGIGDNFSPEHKFDIEGYYAGNALVSLNETGSNDLFTASASGTTKFTIQNSGLTDASVDGIATLVNAGAITDGSYAGNPVDGLMGIDSSNGRLYFRYGGAWHYTAQTAGFQIPDYEAFSYNFEQKLFDKSQPLAEGDFLLPFVENYMEDGAVHGLYAKFSDVKTDIFSDVYLTLDGLQNQFNEITETNQVAANTDNISKLSEDESMKTIFAQIEQETAELYAKIQDEFVSKDELNSRILFTDKVVKFMTDVVYTASTTYTGVVDYISDVTFRGSISVNADTAGEVTIPANTQRFRIRFDNQYDKPPIVYINANEKSDLNVEVVEVTTEYFEAFVHNTIDSDFSIKWFAVMNEESNLDKLEIIESKNFETQATESAEILQVSDESKPATESGEIEE